MVSEGRKGQNNPTKHTQALTLLNYPQLRNKALLIELIPEHPNMYWKETNQEGEEMPRRTGCDELHRCVLWQKQPNQTNTSLEIMAVIPKKVSPLSLVDWFYLFGYHYFPKVLLLHLERNQKLELSRDHYGNSCSESSLEDRSTELVNSPAPPVKTSLSVQKKDAIFSHKKYIYAIVIKKL